MNAHHFNRFRRKVRIPGGSGHRLLGLLFLFAAPHAGLSENTRLQERYNNPDNSAYRSDARLDDRGRVRALYNLRFEFPNATPEEAARAYLSRNAGVLGLVDGESTTEIDRVQRVPGGVHVRFTQSYKGIPVQGGDIVLTTNDMNQVVLVVNNIKPSISVASTRPAITERQAIRFAALAIQKKGLSVGKEDDATLTIFTDDDKRFSLAYRVRITTDDPVGDWEIFVDAQTGSVLRTEDRFVMHTGGAVSTGFGYAYVPDPLSASRHRYNDPGFGDGNDADTDSLTRYRTPVQLDSLTFEDGLYKLQGPWCTVTEIEAPVDPQFYGSPTADGFQYTRSQPGFEAVNVYYHVSTAFRRFLDLGFESASLRQIRLDPHGFQGQDNSHFSPSGNWISWGVEGVDDAEDATAIWHEYGHAIQYNIVPTWGGGESAALGEGYADYWAASYARSVGRWTSADDQYNWVFGWDGHNPYWLGRIVNDKRTYPFGTLPIYSAGQIWSSTLMGIWGELGREITDRLVIKSLYYLGSGTTGPDAAQALLQADRDLYGGQHLQTLIYWLGTVKHFLDPAAYQPSIVHMPLQDSPDSAGPFEIRAVARSAFGIDAEDVRLFWSRNAGPLDSLMMVPTGTPEEYSCFMPGGSTPGVYAYYITATDIAGNVVKAPAGAPEQLFQFQAGIDSTGPALEHYFRPRLAVRDSILTIRATATDETFIDSAWVEYSVGSTGSTASVPLLRSGISSYGAQIFIREAAARAGDSLHYRIFARDGSVSHNTCAVPTAGTYSSRLVAASATVLVIDDGMTGEATGSPSSGTDAESTTLSSSSQLFIRALQSTDFAVEWTRFGDLDTGQLAEYQLVVLSGGTNPTPFNDSSSRAALCNFVSQGGKLLIEGSEVGRYYGTSEGSVNERDGRFRNDLLHFTSYAGSVDSAQLTPLNDSHPIWNSPNQISVPISIGATSANSGLDIVTVDPADLSTSLLAGWSGSRTSGGIVTHCSQNGPDGCSTIYFSFSIDGLDDGGTANALIVNTLSFMWSHGSVASVVVPGEGIHPAGFELSQNYPNPFNPETVIKFSVETTGRTTLRIYNAIGQEVATVFDEVAEAGQLYRVRINGSQLATGVYFYRLESNRRGELRKMLLLK